MNISEEKSRLRKEIKQKRLKMTESDIQVKSNIICNKIINSQFYKESNCIYCYMAIQNEVDLSLVIRDALLADKTVKFHVNISYFSFSINVILIHFSQA